MYYNVINNTLLSSVFNWVLPNFGKQLRVYLIAITTN